MTDQKTPSAERWTLGGWIAAALMTPGCVFGLAFVLNELGLFGFAATSPALSAVPAITFFSGALAVVTTPLALVLAVVFRRSLSTPVKVIIGVGVLGLIAFMLAYANPFYHG